MITNYKKWHYLAVKSLSALLRNITSNHKEEFYCLNCFRSYNTKNKLKKHEKVCNYDYCHVEMPGEENKILKYNLGEKSLKAPFMIYADLECLLEKCTHFKIFLKNLIQKKTKHITKYIFISCSFDQKRNRLDCYRDKDCMERFCKNLKEYN